MKYLKLWEDFDYSNYDADFIGDNEVEITMIPLVKYYQSLIKKEDLIGVKVYDTINNEYVYVKSVDDGLFCGDNKNDKFGHYYKMRDLKIDI